MMQIQLPVDQSKIVHFCQKWQVLEFSLFGSVLRDDFRPDSDVDVLVTFAEGSPFSYMDWPDMQDELKSIFGREIDLISSRGLRNPYRRKEILETREVLYAA
ncbi:TPA: DNA polymerase subunit beta [Candidatus Sumerlaeota bacterium]|nr:DNA polymerase subunit beta [Candidatus Sumerlaeota bacterium]